MMNIFQKKLAVCETLWDFGYQYSTRIRELVNDKSLTLIKTKHHQIYGHYDFDNPKSTQAYDHCVEVQLTSNKQEELTLHIWHGDLTRVERFELRSTFTFQGKWWLIEKLRQELDNRFYKVSEEALLKQERNERRHQIKCMGDSLIAQIDRNSRKS